jgi:5,10-methylenetetrahydromethanopterin reductase
MPALTYGAALFPTEPIKQMVEYARLGEELGLSYLWIGDSHMIWREVNIMLGAAALATSRVTLATGVTNPVTRDITTIASAMASLAELTDGRAALGIGVGDSSVETLGGKRATLDELRTAILEMRALWEGRSIQRNGSSAKLAWADRPRVPVFIAGGSSSPATMRLAGAVADGLVFPGTFSREILDRAWDEIESGAKQAGRAFKRDAFQMVFWLPVAISEDGAEARAWAKPHVARQLNRRLRPDMLAVLNQDEIRIAEEVRQRYDWYHHLESGGKHEDLIPDSIVDRFALAGTPAECREQFQRLRELWGDRVQQVGLVPYSTRPGGRIEVLRHFLEDVAVDAR